MRQPNPYKIESPKILEANKWLIEYDIDGGIGSISQSFIQWKTKKEVGEWFKDAMGYYPLAVMCIGDSRFR